jgi:hypothetical protein
MNLVRDLHDHREKHYSQNGEDGVIERLMEILGPTNRYYVEIGTGDGTECNTRYLRERRWTGIMLDCANEDVSIGLHREFVTAENVNDVLAKYDVPEEFDLLSIDIDGQDHWVWKSMDQRYRPRIVVIEYNAAVPGNVSVTIPYDLEFRWRGQPDTGQSLLAAQKLGTAKGYSLLYASPPNAFLARTSILPEHYREISADTAARATLLDAYRCRKRWKNELHDLSWVGV